MPIPTGESCGNCLYMVAEQGFSPHCCRYAPRATIGAGAPWALVRPQDWCGEWKATPSGGPQTEKKE